MITDYQRYVFEKIGLPGDLVRNSREELFVELFEVLVDMKESHSITPLHRYISIKKRKPAEWYLNRYETLTWDTILDEIAELYVSGSDISKNEVIEEISSLLHVTRFVEEEETAKRNFHIFPEIEIFCGQYGELSPSVEVAYTHGGVFHSDDVCFAALLKIVYPRIRIERVSEVPYNARLAFDIGKGIFDHHQLNAATKPNGKKYSSFGLLWREIGNILFTNEDAHSFETTFVSEIDFVDNYGGTSTFNSIIKSFNPDWQDFTETDVAFDEAVQFTKEILLKQFKRMHSHEQATNILMEYIRDRQHRPTPESLILDVYVPYGCAAKYGIKYVIFPSKRTFGGYHIGICKTSENILFPEEWVKFPPKGIEFVRQDRRLLTVPSRDLAVWVVTSML